MAIETLGQARQHGWTITVRCMQGRPDTMKRYPACIHSYALDLDTLIWTRGHRFPLSDLSSRLKCPRCGSRRVTLLYTLPSDASDLRAAIR